MPLQDLAACTQSDAGNLFRLLRALETLGVFQQTSPGVFANTPVSECLRRDVPGSQWAFVNMLAPGLGLWDGYSEMLDTLRTGKTALFEKWGYDLWEHLRHNPEKAQIFNEGMRSMTAAMTPAVTAACDWNQFPVIADIGGGIGTQLVDILEAHPGCRGVLFDQPGVVAAAIPHDRVECVEGSFFEHIPVEADAYLLRNIIHDWNDMESVLILRTLRKAFKSSARVMLIEWLIPNTPEFNFGKWADITMMAALGGRERTKADFERLFRESGFELEEILPTASPFTITVDRPV
jgi:O-methyltransferase domain